MKLTDLPKSPLEVSLKMVGAKWKILVINELLDGTKRFNEIKKGVKGITQKVLSATLKSLESDGLVEKEVYPQNPPKVEYTLTDVGYSIRPMVEALKSWGKDYKKYIKLLEKFQQKVN